MIQDILYFTLYFFSLLFITLSMVTLAKYRRFQDKKILNSTNTYIFGLLFLAIYIFIATLNTGKFIVKELLINYYSSYIGYLNYLLIISELFIIIFMSVCYLITALLLKEINN